jgi:hypothetical protein
VQPIEQEERNIRFSKRSGISRARETKQHVKQEKRNKRLNKRSREQH